VFFFEEGHRLMGDRSARPHRNSREKLDA